MPLHTKGRPMTYVPSKGPTEMWFIAHTSTLGCGHVISIDFERCLAVLPEQDTLLDPEWERIRMPLPNAFALTTRYSTPDKARMSEKCLRREHTLLTDGIILKSVDVYGSRWRHIARLLGGREKGWSDDIVRKRYMRICAALGGVEPATSTSYSRKQTPSAPQARVQRWADEEDEILREHLADHTKRNDWRLISAAIGVQRTSHATRNRAERLGLGQ